MIYSLSFGLYFSLNTVIPIMIIKKMMKVKRKISNFGKMEGEDYSNIQMSVRNDLFSSNTTVLNTFNN
jgi:hypothetical protein